MGFQIRFLAVARAVALFLTFAAVFERVWEVGLGFLAIGTFFVCRIVGFFLGLALCRRPSLAANGRRHVYDGGRHCQVVLVRAGDGLLISTHMAWCVGDVSFDDDGSP